MVDVTVAYDPDLVRALGVFREEASRFAADPIWSPLLDGVPEVLGVQQLAERGVAIRTLLRTHAGKQWEVARGFRYRILERLSRERIAIAAMPNVSALGKTTLAMAAGETTGDPGQRPMTLQLHNTLTRRVEPFAPLAPPDVSLYTCGPTVYGYAHIGNFRTFLFEDLLRRWLEASGYRVFHVMNLTDVDDKIDQGCRPGRDVASSALHGGLHHGVP